jgi:hypothetical protein
VRTLLAAIGAVAVASAALSGCSFNIGINTKPTVSKDALQKDISDRLVKAGEQPQSVTCKDDLVGEVGNTTRCEVVLSATNAFEPMVTVSSVDGDTINYDMTPALSKDQLEKTVSGLVANAAGMQVDSVSCVSGLEGKVGAVAYCDVNAGGVKLRRTVEVDKVDGMMMNLYVVPVLSKAEVESSLLEELEQQVGQRPDWADCSDNLQGKPGTAVTCNIVAGPETASFIVTVTTVQGDKINYSYKPKS